MRKFIFILFIAFLPACGLLPERSTPAARPQPTHTAPPISAAADEATEPAAGGAAPTASLPAPSPIAEAVASPLPEEPAATAAPLAAAREATARELVDVIPPLRDDVRLAVGYLGADTTAATPPAADDLQVGMTETFYIGNVDSNTVSQIEAELMGVGEHAYFWFDLGDGSVRPDAADLETVVQAFDDIYDYLYGYLGVAEPVGGRAHIVHASPAALCNQVNNCGLAGYFSSRDLLPRAVYPQSNERSMFVMNTQQFGGASYLDTLSHEFRHMLGEDYDAGEEDWFVEGAAMLAEELVGFASSPQARGSLFLQNPDQQLNSWTDLDSTPYYGQGYLVNRFLYDRLGEDLYRAFTHSLRPGLSAVDDVATAAGLDVTGEGLWLDWLAAMVVNRDSSVPEQYRWDGPDVQPVAMRPVNNLPAVFETTVDQFAADYYELPSSGAAQIDFAGAPAVPLLGPGAPSGEHVWYAQRANYSNPRLTRAIDLRDVAAATLRYKVYADIERGYDFAYVAASTDGGETWQPLVADGMQGLSTADDPSDNALADRFYTGRSQQWLEEEIDLAAFAGEEIMLRFEYVTDPILTFGGFALDDITIPEIGLFDDAETLDPGWTAEGFTRATAELPQPWRLQLMTFDADGQPTVTPLPVGEDGRAQTTYQGMAGGRRPVLIVAANAPETLQAAPYTLSVAVP